MKKRSIPICLFAMILLMFAPGIVPHALAGGGQCAANPPLLWDIRNGIPAGSEGSWTNGVENNAPPFKCYWFDVPANTAYLIINIEAQSQTTLDLYHSEGQPGALGDDDLVNAEPILAGGQTAYGFVQPVPGRHTIAVASSGDRSFNLSPTTMSVASTANNQVAASCENGCRTAQSLNDFGLHVGSKIGDQVIFPIEIGGPGTIAVTATWTGQAQRLALILNGPKHAEYSRAVGSGGSVSLRYTVTQNDYNNGYKWSVRLANVSGGYATGGNVTINYPGTSIRIAKLLPLLPGFLKVVPPGNPPISVIPTCGGNIGNQQTISAAIPAQGRDCRYTFSGAPGDRINIGMAAVGNQLDPFLELIDPNGNRVAFDDDSGGRPNSLISGILIVGGNYTIVAGSYNKQSSGPFELTLNQEKPVLILPSAPFPVPQPLANCPDPNASWENVAEGQTLSPIFAFVGTAISDNFLGYVVEFNKPGNVLYASRTPVFHGVIFNWDTNTVANGEYLLALTVSLRDGSRLPTCFVRVRVSH